MKQLKIDLGEKGYNIYIERGLRRSMARLFNIGDRRAFILTDSGVPSEYAREVACGFSEAYIYTVPSGEGAKSLSVFSDVCSEMLRLGIGRGDVCIACGGGVVGDLAGFAAATFMRGIDFYNVPTTLLSMVDSSIGGKTAVNHDGVKNIIGAFYQPRGVLIDTEVLSTLQRRQLCSGMAEIIKMAMTSDGELFSMLEGLGDARVLSDIDDEAALDTDDKALSGIDDEATSGKDSRTILGMDNDVLEDIILRALRIKKQVVEADEREAGLRKVLNFGHTFGHAVEAATSLGRYNHGECVAIGMMAVTSGEVRKRLSALLKKFDLPVTADADIEEILPYVASDKKRVGGDIDAVFVERIGDFDIRRMAISNFEKLVRKNLGE